MNDVVKPIEAYSSSSRSNPAQAAICLKYIGNGLHAEIGMEMSFAATTGGTSQSVAISTTSAQSTAIAGNYVMLYSTADCFLRQGADPAALSDGTDQFVPAGVMLRVGITSGNKLAFKTASGAGTVYLTPGA